MFAEISLFLESIVKYGNYIAQVFNTIKRIGPKVAIRTLTCLLFLLVLDATGKIPDGVLEGNLFSLGNFDECYDTESLTIPDNVTFYGKYCLGSKDGQFQGQKLDFKIGYCIPSFVKAEQISGFFNFTEDSCASRDNQPELTTGAICTIVVICLFVIAVIVSTLYHVVLQYKGREPKSEFLLPFSLISNCRRLFASSSSQISCLHGLKAISMLWIVLGHHYSADVLHISNSLFVPRWMQKKENMYLLSANLAVDTFLIIGGLLNSYIFLKCREKKMKYNFLMDLLFRLVRIWPSVIIVLMVHLFLTPYLGNGPFWKTFVSGEKINCNDNWWSDLLFVGNYYNVPHFCDAIFWYLSVDMQLFLLSPLILLPLSKWPKPSLVGLGMLIVLGCISPIVQGIVSEVNFSFGTLSAFVNKYYFKTHTRFGPYVIGILFGYLLHKGNKKVFEARPILVFILWLMCLTILSTCVFVGNEMIFYTTYNFWSSVWQLGFQRQLWSFGIGTMILLCTSDAGGPINSFLSLSLFSWLSKLSYSMYLLNNFIVTLRLMSERQVKAMSDFSEWHTFCGDVVLIVIASLWLYFVIEVPVATYIYQTIKRKMS